MTVFFICIYLCVCVCECVCVLSPCLAGAAPVVSGCMCERSSL